jgi:hypothetical protein
MDFNADDTDSLSRKTLIKTGFSDKIQNPF